MSKCQKSAKIPKSPKMPNITKRVKYHQKCRKLPKMLKPKNHRECHIPKKMPNITTNAKNCTTFQNHKKRPKICKSANNHQTCQKSTKMSKCQIAEIPKSPKMQNITKKIQYHKKCKQLKKMPKPKNPR